MNLPNRSVLGSPFDPYFFSTCFRDKTMAVLRDFGVGRGSLLTLLFRKKIVRLSACKDSKFLGHKI